MVGTPIRWSLALGAAVLGLALAAAPSSAQQVGQIKGKVVDAQNKPIEGAKIIIAMVDGASRKHEIKSKKGGDFLQIGLMPGNYKITAEKDGMSQEFSFHVSIGETKEVNFMLQPGGQAAGGQMTKEDAAKQAARVEGIKTKFAEGATLSNDGKYDEAIAKFQEVLVDVPKCAECYLNIGSVYAQKKEYDKAEESYRKVLELNPDSVDAYNGLATIFNSQKKFTEAQEMSARGDQARQCGQRRHGQSRGALQPGGHRLERERLPEGAGELHRGPRGQGRPRRVALHAREGVPEPRQAARCGQRVRDVHEDRTDRPEREGSGLELRDAEAVHQVRPR